MRWSDGSHERRVERFYSTGIDWMRDPHGFNDDLLNFGLGPRSTPYIERARDLILYVANMHLDIRVEDRLLDVGCGMGRQSEILINTFMPKAYCGMDVTEKHIMFCKDRFARFSRGIHGETFVEFKHASATAIPYADSTFTKVVSIEGVPHFDTRLRFFREAYRVLKPGGVLACADFTLLLHPKTRLERFLVRAGARAWCVPQENIYDYRRVVFLLDRTGFDNVRCELLGSDTIPGYFWGHRSFSAMRGMRKIRGFFKGVLGGLVIDCAAYWLFKRGLLEYVVYSAKKPDR